MTINQVAAVLLSACPDCGAFVTDRSFHRNGWYSAECGRRYHRERDDWEPMAPTGCLSRQLEEVKRETEEMTESFRILRDGLRGLISGDRDADVIPSLLHECTYYLPEDHV